MRQKSFRWLLLVASLGSVGCGSSNNVWITGTLLKGGVKFVPTEGRQAGITFYHVGGQDQSKPGTTSAEPYQATYNTSDGTFSVPGREGNGIPAGKYQIAISERMTRETLDKLGKTDKTKRGPATTITRETDFFEGTFGPQTSPIVREFKTSENVIIDLNKPQ